MKKRYIAALLAGTLACTALFGCGNTAADDTSAESSAESGESAQDSSDESSDDSTAEESTEEVELEYSKYLTDDGFIEGVTALDYVTVPDFKTYTFAKSDIEPTDEEIQSQIDTVMSSKFTEDVEGEIQDGDTVVMDYVGTVDGEEFENQTDVSVTAGSDDYVDDFLTKIIGHKVGETFDIEVTFPDDYSNTDVAGKTTNFNITIKSATRPRELTDELVQNNQDTFESYFGQTMTSAQDVKDFIYDYYYASNLKSALYDKLTEDVSVDEIPETVQNFSRNMLNITTNSYYGLTLDEFCESISYSDEDLQSQVDTDSKLYLLFQAIAEQEGYKATDDDLKEMIGSDDLTSYIETYGRGYLARYYLEDKAYEYMESLVTVE